MGMRIQALALLLSSLLLGGAFGGTDKRAEAEALFAHANSLMGLDQSGEGAPYTVKGHFHLLLNQPVDGTLFKAVLRQRDTWRSEISFPGYSEVVVRNGDRKWVRRNFGFTPLRVKRLVEALPAPLTISEKEKVEKVKEEMAGQTRAKCVKLREKGVEREVCIDATTGLPLYTKSSWGVREEVDYESYTRVGDKEFPQQIRLAEGGKLIAELSLDSLSLDSPDKSLFEPLQDAKVWPVCNDTKAPVPISTPDPYYTDVDRRKGVQGVVAVQAVIDETGQTHDVTVIRSLTPGLDSSAQAAVSKWRFKPAMCGNTPIPVEMSIEVSFRL